MISDLFGVVTQSRQFAEEREAETRSLRRPVYQIYLDAANAYAVAHERRLSECKPGTDEPRAPEGRCLVSLMGELQQTRFEYRGAINDVSMVASEEAMTHAYAMAMALPTAAPAPDGVPVEGPVDAAAFSDHYNAFLDVARCDTAPNVVCG